MKVLIVVCLLQVAFSEEAEKLRLEETVEAIAKSDDIPPKDRVIAISQLTSTLDEGDISDLKDPEANKVLDEAIDAPPADVNPAVLTKLEEDAIVAVLETEDLSKKAQEMDIARITDGAPLSIPEAQQIAEDLKADNKFENEDAQILRDLTKKENVEELNKEIKEEDVKEVLADVLVDPSIPAEKKPEVVAEIADELLTEKDKEDITDLAHEEQPRLSPYAGEQILNEANELIEKKQELEKADQDGAFGVLEEKVTQDELKAVEEIAKADLIEPANKIQMMAEVLEGQTLNEEEAGLLKKELQEDVPAKELETIIDSVQNPQLMAELNEETPVVPQPANDDSVDPKSTEFDGSRPFPIDRQDHDEFATGFNSVFRLMGERMKRYLHKDNHDKIRMYSESAESKAWVAALFDANKDGRISSDEWSSFYSKLAAYWENALKKPMPVPMEEWMTVDTNRDGFIDIEKEFYPALFSMVTEPLWQALTSAYFYYWDVNMNGFIDQEPFASNPRFASGSEWEWYQKSPVVARFMALPAAPAEELEDAALVVNETAGTLEMVAFEEEMAAIGVNVAPPVNTTPAF
jgi:hypothetical protein